jgi:hypothetical protein
MNRSAHNSGKQWLAFSFALGYPKCYLPYMIPTPTEIFTRIKDGSLLHPAVVVRLDHDSILDERNGEANFEAQWMRCYNQIEDRWRSAEVKQDLAALIDDVRRESFLSVSRATAQHEIASYVSDDFDLIVRGAVLGINDDFLNRLWDAYNRNEIPTPKNGK